MESFPHDSQYKVFQVAYQVGVFVSRSSGSYIHIDRIWVLSLLQVSLTSPSRAAVQCKTF